jgi:hypothetical protein
MVGGDIDIAGAGGRISAPYVGNGPDGGTAGVAAVAGPARYVAPESLTVEWMPVSVVAAGASNTGACAAEGAVDATSDIAG